MTGIQQQAGSPFDAIRRDDEAGEYWTARDLMPLLGYTSWDRVPDVIDRARAAINNSAGQAPDHIRGASKMVPIGSGAERALMDYRLTRYAAYVVAMNGDPRKPEVASAQSYFAVKTREAEQPAPLTLPGRKQLAQMVIEAETARELAEARVAELTPSAAAWDHLASTDGDLSVNEAAKVLSRDPAITIGERRLWNLLLEWRWLYRDGHGDVRPYQQHVDNGRLACRARSHHHPRTGELLIDAPQVRVTPKGLADIRTRLATAAVNRAS